ncbi:eukaryotic initiation factor-2B [Cryptosporidium sp. chipmunk genotype I]|uniref:eukaryotic initiation factor-2B n=1 Tax=Cryptosporidium sp. chipmunk genotype I TaxID=1280935 RepID=UPI00351AAE76|nr:eukaryotic initiation factor-2B [Cryptosporidium sp. chipmunk genotype I]
MASTNERFLYSSEFKGVVFAGGSGRMLGPLTKNVSKAMIPVCNKPMIWYPISNLIQHRIRDICIFCEEEFENSIRNYISETFSNDKIIKRFEFEESYKQNIKVIGLKEDECSLESSGTWSILSEHGRDFLRDSDFFVLTCDIIGPLDLLGLANKHRLSQAVCTVLLIENPDLSKIKNAGKQNSNTNNQAQANSIGGISVDLQKDKNKSIFVLDEKEEVILSMKDFYSAKQENEVFELSKLQLFWHPNVSLRTDLIDLHVYLFKSSIFKILEIASGSRKISTIEYPEDGIESIRLELLPFLAKNQHVPGSELWGRSKFDCHHFLDDEITISNDSSVKFTKIDLPPKIEGTSVSYFLQKLPENSSRVNTVMALHECNLAATSPANLPAWLVEEHSIGTSVGKEVIIGQKCNIGKNVQLRRCVIGSNVEIGDGSKIVNCVILDNAKIGSKCTIQNSVIGGHSEIGDSCKISYSVVEHYFKVEANSKSQGETMEKRDELFEISI